MRNTNFMILCMIIALGRLSYARIQENETNANTEPAFDATTHGTTNQATGSGTPAHSTTSTNSTGTNNARNMPEGPGTANTISTTYSTSSHYDVTTKGGKTKRSKNGTRTQHNEKMRSTTTGNERTTSTTHTSTGT